MKKIFFFIITAIISLLFITISWSAQIQKNIARGVYVHTDKITFGTLRKLPIPKTNEDYAFLQCIDETCNVVVGKFSSGHREIILYQDRNVDGKVDRISHYDVSKRLYRHKPNPNKLCPPDKFKKMKEDILFGRKSDITPNSEGIKYIKYLFNDSDNIRRHKTGFRIRKRDEIDGKTERIVYTFYVNASGASAGFNVHFRNKGYRISPIINMSVYAKDSKDKFVVEAIKNLVKEGSEFSPPAD